VEGVTPEPIRVSLGKMFGSPTDDGETRIETEQHGDPEDGGYTRHRLKNLGTLFRGYRDVMEPHESDKLLGTFSDGRFERAEPAADAPEAADGPTRKPALYLDPTPTTSPNEVKP
jgi:hypothetical protein